MTALKALVLRQAADFARREQEQQQHWQQVLQEQQRQQQALQEQQAEYQTEIERLREQVRLPQTRQMGAAARYRGTCHGARSSMTVGEEERICPHDGARLEPLGEDISEQLDIIPARMEVIRHIHRKYACPCCEQQVRTAPLPSQPIPKSIASPGLLACVTGMHIILRLRRNMADGILLQQPTACRQVKRRRTFSVLLSAAYSKPSLNRRSGLSLAGQKTAAEQ